jgi:hypothetical protein
MEGDRGPAIKAWQLPLAVAAIALPVIGATLAGGPAAGLGASFLVAATIVFIAVRMRPDEPIGGRGAQPSRLLVVACTAIDGPAALRPVLDQVARLGADDAQVMVVAPSYTGRLASWTSDLQPGRVAAAERLVITLAGLAAAGVDARSRVGDEDPVLATEDADREWPAGQILFVTDAGDERAAQAAAEVGRRARVPVRHVALEGAVSAG